MLQWAQAVRQLYDEAKAWLHSQAAPTLEERRQKYASCTNAPGAWASAIRSTASIPAGPWPNVCCAIRRSCSSSCCVPGVPADNNLAERSLRPLVIMRKISGGTRSDEGSKTRLTLASLFGTWQARHLNPFIECLAALQQPAQLPSRRRHNSFTPTLNSYFGVLI